jgi:hypothetical protein
VVLIETEFYLKDNLVLFSGVFGYLLLRGGAVVEALRYKPEGRRIDSRWCYWNFSLT